MFVAEHSWQVPLTQAGRPSSAEQPESSTHGVHVPPMHAGSDMGQSAFVWHSQTWFTHFGWRSLGHEFGSPLPKSWSHCGWLQVPLLLQIDALGSLSGGQEPPVTWQER